MSALIEPAAWTLLGCVAILTVLMLLGLCRAGSRDFPAPPRNRDQYEEAA